jgi:hypothetical protein
VARIISAVEDELVTPKLDQGLGEAGELLARLIGTDAYVGEVYSLGYNEALVQIHDFHRQQVGG